MLKYTMNICQYVNPAEFSVGGEQWNVEDIPEGGGPPLTESDMSQFDNSFYLQ